MAEVGKEVGGRGKRRVGDLSPQEVMALAIAIEEFNAVNYRECADRFRPFDPAASKLLEELAEEEIEHGETLRQAYYDRFGSFLYLVDPKTVDVSIEDFRLDMDHFFVVNKPMARKILWAALQAEIHAKCFYEQVMAIAKDPALREVYSSLLVFEAGHVKSLKERSDKVSGAQ